MATSMDSEPEILPYLHRIFADLEDLGCQAEEVLAVLEGQPLAPGASALDLGCGKGAVALALAKTLDLRVQAVDGMEDFLEHARNRARSLELDQLCTFRLADLREVVRQEREHDLVSMLALGSVLGDLSETIGVLRQCVKPGGLVLIDDAYLDPTRAAGTDLADIDCPEHDAALAMLTAHGDRILGERVIDGPESTQVYLRMLDAMEGRAQALATEEPDMGEAIQDFVSRQRAETELLMGPVVGALWLLQRVD
jgi:ubiquinone/menaquinone biosynthesis C-methylase UbiE